MKARILVIDDDADVRDSLKMILEYEGYDCLLAPSGQEGIGRVERERPDLVFVGHQDARYGRTRGCSSN